VRTIAGECWFNDEDDEEFDGNRCGVLIEGDICSVWKTGDNGSSDEEFGLSREQLADRDDLEERSSSPRKKTLLFEGCWYDDDDVVVCCGERDGVSVSLLDADEKAAFGMEKPPDELSINFELLFADRRSYKDR